MDCRAVLSIFYLRTHPEQLYKKPSEIAVSSAPGTEDIDAAVASLLEREPSQELLDKIDEYDKKTLGQNASDLKKQKIISDQFSVLLKEAVSARNNLIHSTYFDFEETEESEIEGMTDVIVSEVRTIAKADKYIAGMLAFFNKDPQPGPQFFEEFEVRVVEWVTTPTF